MTGDLTSPPVATVVIPAYNAAATLDGQLTALAGQTGSESFEVLVCDNGSSDATRSIVEAKRALLPELRLVDASARRGAAAARNIGAAAARSGLLLFCDADDVVAADWVHHLVEALRDREFVVGLMEHALLNPGEEWDAGWAAPTYRESFLPWLPAGGSGNMGIRAAAYRSLGGFDETRLSGEDADLCWRAQLAGLALTPVPEAVVHIRKRSGVRATINQSWAKGRAVRQLQHDYALVSAAFRSSVAARPPAETQAGTARGEGRAGRLRRAPRRLLTLLHHPRQLLRECAEVTKNLALRFAPIDISREQVVPGDVTDLLNR